MVKSMNRRWLCGLLIGGLATSGVTAQTPLERLEGCVLVEVDWADGDSFPIRTGTGENLTVRLYGVDALETTIGAGDETGARRLREQRRYFGITACEPTPEAAIAAAKAFGAAATRQREIWLAEPFTVHTARADGRGDPRYQRVYAFVTRSDGRDLGEALVEAGLARAFGVYRATPDGGTHDDYRERLRDLELQAAISRRGIWAATNWEMLPEERRLQREEANDLALAMQRQGGPVEPVGVNTASRDELMQIDGIGEVMANRIIEQRPFRSLDDLVRVHGIGPETLKKLRPFLKPDPAAR